MNSEDFPDAEAYAEAVHRLLRTAGERLGELGLKPIDALDDRLGGERHGNWDLTWVGPRSAGGQCFTTLVSWPVDARLGEPDWTTFHAQVWAGAHDGTRFGRYLIRDFGEVHAREMVDRSERLSETVSATLVQGALFAKGLAANALNRSYVAQTERQWFTQ